MAEKVEEVVAETPVKDIKDSEEVKSEPAEPAPKVEDQETTDGVKTEDSTVAKNDAADSGEATEEKVKVKEDEDDKSDKDYKENKETAVERTGDNKRKYKDDRHNRKDPREDLRKYRDSRKNVKTDFEALPETDDHDEILKQVEFYFSDSNLFYDDHMRSLVLGNREDKYGANESVPVAVIHSFKRMRRFQPYTAVLAAIKESKTLDLVGEKEDEIRRKEPLKKPDIVENDFKDPSIPRAIYAKGFPEESRTTQFDIEGFFTPYGPLNSVRLRRSHPDRLFKGSVFVEFETEELQKEFLAIDPKPKFEGKELQIMSKREYCEMKVKDINDGKVKRNNNYKNYYRPNFNNNDRGGRGRGNFRGRDDRGDRGGRGGRGRGRGRGGNRDDRDNRNGHRDRNDWKSRREDFQKGGRDEYGRKARGGLTDEDKAAVDKILDQAEGGAKKDSSDKQDSPSKKRDREEDGEKGESEAKKVKAVEAET
ncbi:hypothetical protein BT63DRAFT_442152 [Microthyrium microscopicum]|uniref:HTH La-type RNA-binding domain-containing protein n=1 Tax=Microthyrium microscopicum TaxID=703497 RepID=A0A6A6U7U8_9PEZI|nr:hypothetical protein BT63DRAFT_442152 [Microthyrium microscopicum]